MSDLPHNHAWVALQVAFYALRRCKDCGVIGRNSSGRLKVLQCQTCKTASATEWRLGAPYCADHVPKPGNLRTLKDMTEEEVRELEKLYGAPVRRRK